VQGASPERARKVMTELITAVLRPLSTGRRSRA